MSWQCPECLKMLDVSACNCVLAWVKHQRSKDRHDDPLNTEAEMQSAYEDTVRWLLKKNDKHNRLHACWLIMFILVTIGLLILYEK